MFSSPDEVLEFIKAEDVKFVDIRFCDLPGIMQHFNVPAESIDEDFFTEGQMFDGSSIRGFQAIHESDMKLVPDLETGAGPSGMETMDDRESITEKGVVTNTTLSS